jgi:hypothetical protein
MKHLIFTSLSDAFGAHAQQLKSPNESLYNGLFVTIGTPTYALKYKTKSYKTSKLGLELKTTKIITE